ncbi:MAG: transporter substrate-binding domain-containing protein [Chloroflexota bacterium]
MSYRILAILVVGLLLLGGWWFWPASDDGTLAEIQRRGTLRIGLDASFPPFETITADNQIVGLDIDIANAVAADLGVTLEIVNIGFDGLYDALLARRVDLVISGLPYDPHWTEDVAYTHNYFNAGQVLIIQDNNQTITSIDDLDNKIVSIEWGSQADMEARQLERQMTNITLLRQETAAQALDMVLTQQADASIVDGVTGVGAVPRGIKIITYLTDEWYAAAVHIESQALLKAVNRSLEQLDESGGMAALQAKWLHSN